jgi:hypothetical protein
VPEGAGGAVRGGDAAAGVEENNGAEIRDGGAVEGSG